MTLPKLCTVLLTAALAVAITEPAAAQDEVEGVRAKRFRVGGDRDLQYVLIGSPGELTVPDEGYKLLVVLPGGDGSADFSPFVQRIWKHALDENYFVIQLIAPKWNNKQRIVWPTAKAKERGMKTSTEAFVAKTVAEVQSRTKVDQRHIFAMGWSSGGPAAYAASVADDSPITGTLAAMSVFHPHSMADLAAAEGHAYYILHSEADQVCPYRMAKRASEQLTSHGATTKLVTYAGGHGWQGDVYGNIRAGIGWLEEQAATP